MDKVQKLSNSEHNWSFEIFITLIIKILVFWVVAPCNFVGKCHRFGGIYLVHHNINPNLNLYKPIICHVTRNKMYFGELNGGIKIRILEEI
jgi:hypothetical protein